MDKRIIISNIKSAVPSTRSYQNIVNRNIFSAFTETENKVINKKKITILSLSSSLLAITIFLSILLPNVLEHKHSSTPVVNPIANIHVLEDEDKIAAIGSSSSGTPMPFSIDDCYDGWINYSSGSNPIPYAKEITLEPNNYLTCYSLSNDTIKKLDHFYEIEQRSGVINPLTLKMDYLRYYKILKQENKLDNQKDLVYESTIDLDVKEIPSVNGNYTITNIIRETIPLQNDFNCTFIENIDCYEENGVVTIPNSGNRTNYMLNNTNHIFICFDIERVFLNKYINFWHANYIYYAFEVKQENGQYIVESDYSENSLIDYGYRGGLKETFISQTLVSSKNYTNGENQEYTLYVYKVICDYQKLKVLFGIDN